MMIFSQRSKLYGKAFIRSFYENSAENLPYESYLQWTKELSQYKKHLILLAMGSVSQKIKTTIIEAIIRPYNFKSLAEKKLLELLHKKRDIDLLPEITQYLCASYQEIKGLEKWTITSALSLTTTEKKTIISSLEQKTKKTVIPTFAIDAKLYAGFTVRHPMYYWDCSIRSFLKKVAYFAQNQES